MTTIGSASPSGTGSYDSYTIGRYGQRILTGEAAEKARAESAEFTKTHAHLKNADYLKAMFEESERTSPERLASGFANETIKVRVEDRTFTLAVTRLDVSLAQATEISEAPLAEVSQPDFARLQAAQARLRNLQEMEPEPSAPPGVADGSIQTAAREDWALSHLHERLRWGG